MPDVMSANVYYPFGMAMPGRKFAAGGDYRYGFNGKEKDKDISVGDLDFGARVYDGRIGRWLSLDPLADKYPGASPYNFTANNPILYVDGDGRDYGVYIDHKTKTVIIKVTYYTVKGDDATNAHHGAKKWNDQSDKWQLAYGSGEKYKIKFELTVKEYDDAGKRDAAFTSDRSGEGNKFVTSPPNPVDWGSTKSENGGKANSVDVENTAAAQARFTPSHEMGHTLGLGHFIDGLMESGSTRAAGEADNNITVAMISKILNNAGLGSLVQKATDKETIPNPSSVQAKVVLREVGTRPLSNAEKEKLSEEIEGSRVPTRDNLGGSQGAYPAPKKPLTL